MIKEVELVLRYRVEVDRVQDFPTSYCRVAVKVSHSKEIDKILKENDCMEKLVFVKASNNKFYFEDEVDGDGWEIPQMRYQIVDVESGLYLCNANLVKSLGNKLEKIIGYYKKMVESGEHKNLIERVKNIPNFTQEEYVRNWYNLYKPNIED